MKWFLTASLSVASAFGGADWMRAQIDEDLSPFALNSISKSAIKKQLENKRVTNWHSDIIHIAIQNGEPKLLFESVVGVDWIRERVEQTMREISNWQKSADESERLPDCEFLLSIGDGLDTDVSEGVCDLSAITVPIFVFSKRDATKKLVLFPDPGAMCGRQLVMRRVTSGNSLWPWEKKKNILFFRGAGTDGEYDADWASRPRAKLSVMSKQYPERIDSGLVSLPHANSVAIVSDIVAQTGTMPRIYSMREQVGFKYLIDLDGCSNGWERCFWILLSNSALFKHETEFSQWFYKALKPWKHYVPLKADLSDVMERLDWAESHDDEVKMIAEEGQKLVGDIFPREKVFAYMREVLTEYNKRFKD